MAETTWGKFLGACTLVAGSVAALPAAVVGGAYTAVNGDGFEKGADAAMNVVEKAAEKAEEFGDEHADTLTKNTLGLAFAVAGAVIRKGIEQPPDPPRQLGA